MVEFCLIASGNPPQGSGNLERVSNTRESSVIRRVIVGRTMCLAG